MSTEVKMPQMGESVFEGTITKWLKKVGETVKQDEPLFEISTDKVDSEIPSPAGGVLAEILVPEGKTVQINTIVALIAGEGDGVAEKALAEPESSPEIKAPPPEAIASATPPLETGSPLAPAVKEKSVEPEAVVEVRPADIILNPMPEIPAVPPAAGLPREIRTSPLVRRLAREHSIDLMLVQGTGLDGRITKQDVLDYIERRSTALSEIQRGAAAGAPAVAERAPEISTQEDAVSMAAAAGSGAEQSLMPRPAEIPPFAGEAERVLMTPMRKAIADHMVLSMHTSPHVHTVFEIDLTSIVQLRDKHKADFERREGIKLTFTPFFAKALVETVRDFPVMNCSVQGDTIIYKKPVNLGIAVSLDNGLIVPVIKSAELKSFTGLALAIQDLASRAKTKRLRVEEVQNGTISITNPGIYGGLFSTPIINQPQAAILGIGGVDKRPVVVNDMIAIRSMVCLSLAFDHRVIDGAVADQFMAKLKERLQNWTRWAE
jgi:pyruvate dehydrogenase E2 component (dihydrolipoamide acetyltransferase)